MRKIVLLSNCILNNEDQSKELVKFLAEYGIGMVQLPCPKGIFGINNVSKKKCPRAYRNYCKELSTKIMEDMRNFSNDCKILGIVGIEFSENCGVHKFTSGKKGWGKGIFFEELEKQMQMQNMQIPFFGLDSTNAISMLRKFQTLIENS